MRLPTPVGSHPSQPAKPKLGTICRRVVMSDFFPICNKWWSSTYRRMSFKLSVLPFCVWVPFFHEKHNHRQKEGKRIYAKRIMRPALFFPSLSLLLDVSSATSAYQEFFISLFFSNKSRLRLWMGPNDQQHKCVLHGPIHINLMRFRWAQKERGETKPKADSTAPVYFLVTIYIVQP
jgi:hypothetical protein